jgi:hypothetical protein
MPGQLLSDSPQHSGDWRAASSALAYRKCAGRPHLGHVDGAQSSRAMTVAAPRIWSTGHIVNDREISARDSKSARSAARSSRSAVLRRLPTASRAAWMMLLRILLVVTAGTRTSAPPATARSPSGSTAASRTASDRSLVMVFPTFVVGRGITASLTSSVVTAERVLVWSRFSDEDFIAIGRLIPMCFQWSTQDQAFILRVASRARSA